MRRQHPAQWTRGQTAGQDAGQTVRPVGISVMGAGHDGSPLAGRSRKGKTRPGPSPPGGEPHSELRAPLAGLTEPLPSTAAWGEGPPVIQSPPPPLLATGNMFILSASRPSLLWSTSFLLENCPQTNRGALVEAPAFGPRMGTTPSHPDQRPPMSFWSLEPREETLVFPKGMPVRRGMGELPRRGTEPASSSRHR